MKSSRNDSNPGPGNYSVSDYNTIEKPIVTGGAPANEFAFKKHERMKSERESESLLDQGIQKFSRKLIVALKTSDNKSIYLLPPFLHGKSSAKEKKYLHFNIVY